MGKTSTSTLTNAAPSSSWEDVNQGACTFPIRHSGAVQRTEPGIHNHRSSRAIWAEFDPEPSWLWIPALASLDRNDGAGARA